MSRWLRSVNTILDQIDTGTENVKEATITTLLGNRQDDDDDDEYYSDEEEEENDDAVDDEIPVDEDGKPPANDDDDYDDNIDAHPHAAEPEPPVDTPSHTAHDDAVSANVAPKAIPMISKPPPLKKAPRISARQYSQLEADYVTLQQELHTTKTELAHHLQELNQAADNIQDERLDFAEQLQEWKDDHRRTMDQLSRDHQQALQNQAVRYQDELSSLRVELHDEQEERRLQHDDLDEQMVTMKRQHDHTKQELEQLQMKKIQLQGELTQSKAESQRLYDAVDQWKSTTSQITADSTAVQKQMDDLRTQHAQELQRHQTREQHLEQQIQELTTTVVVLSTSSSSSQQKQQLSTTTTTVASTSNQNVKDDDDSWWQDELQVKDAEILALQQRNELLTSELHTLAVDQSTEMASWQQQVVQKDDEIQRLVNQMASLQKQLQQQQQESSARTMNASITPTVDEHVHRRLVQQCEGMKAQVLTLQGRLASAIVRAETAEAAQQHTTPVRRRRRRYNTLPTRSLLSSVGLGQYPVLAQTLEDVDDWMLETGNLLRHEPWMRLGFLCYLLLIHVGCFGLVFFHAVESERHDLRELRPRGMHAP